MKRVFWAICVLTTATTSAQTKWYKFSKSFVNEHYKQDSAIGVLHSGKATAAKNVHPRSCDGKDGELHMGVEGADVIWSKQGQEPISSLASEADSGFGIVAEPPNVSSSGKTKIDAFADEATDFFGYFRLWNEGHDVGKIAASNPHHVLEVHPTWALHSSDHTLGNPSVASAVASIPGFSGYGASKFVPLLSSVNKWLKVAEDNQFIYVQLTKADNFYQLPVIVKSIRPVTGGVEALVDVYSDIDRRLIYKNLTVVMAKGSRITTQIAPNARMYLLGFFSVNLRKTATIALGHTTPQTSVSGLPALEFFAFGVPLQKAALSSACDEEDDGE